MYLTLFLVHPKDNRVLYDKKIAVNLDKMAAAAGVYKALWQPYENKYAYGRDMVGVLEDGLKELHNKPGYYKTFEPQSGPETYNHLVNFVDKTLKACLHFPDAVITQIHTEA